MNVTGHEMCFLFTGNGFGKHFNRRNNLSLDNQGTQADQVVLQPLTTAVDLLAWHYVKYAPNDKTLAKLEA